MRMCVLLALTAGSLLAADPPKDDESTNKAEKLFRTMTYYPGIHSRIVIRKIECPSHRL